MSKLLLFGLFPADVRALKSASVIIGSILLDASQLAPNFFADRLN
jgi:hypothetical protein